MNTITYIILHNIIAPYKTLVFNELSQIMGEEFKVLYMAGVENIREWRVEKHDLKFSFDIMFEGSIDNVNSFKLAAETYRRLNLYDPEVVIVGGYSYICCWAAFIWAKVRNKKIILINESHYLDKPRFFLKEITKKLFISNCDAALVDGTRHRDYTVSLGLKSDRIFIKKGTGPVDIDWYQEVVSKFKPDKAELCKKFGIPLNNFLFVGRISYEKNIIFLLKAYKRLKGEGVKDWGLILVGNGPQKQEVENFISKHNLKDVYLPGFKQKEEVPIFYAISNVFILPSISEPWGLVVSEAMASGLPVLVSKKCGCYPDIVHDSINGFSFDPFSVDELLIHMKNVIGGKYALEKMGRASLEIIKDYTPEKVAKVYKHAIQFVMQKNEGTSYRK